MAKKILYLLLFLLICQTAVFSQLSRMRRDGLWWEALDGNKKYNYVVGYSKGIFMGSDAVIERYIKGSKCYKRSRASIDSLSKKLLKINVDYLLYRIDSLYQKDSLNTGMMVFHTYWIAVNQLIDTPPKETNQMYYYYRREDCARFKSLQELRDYKLSY